MENSNQPIGSEGGNGAIQPTKVGEYGNNSSNVSKNKKIRTEKKSGEEKGENSSENGERGSYMGSPHHLKEKIAKTRDEKREKLRILRFNERMVILKIGRRELRKIGRWRK